MARLSSAFLAAPAPPGSSVITMVTPAPSGEGFDTGFLPLPPPIVVGTFPPPPLPSIPGPSTQLPGTLPQIPLPGFPPIIPGQVHGPTGALQFDVTPEQGTAACNLLPPGALRNACLAASGFFTGGGGGLPALPELPGGGGTVANGTEVGPVAQGLAVPTTVAVQKMQCPRFGNGKIGVLWMSNLTGQVFCLPRGASGGPFGLSRLHPPGTKPLLTGGEVKCLNKSAALIKRLRKSKVIKSITHKHTR